MIMMMSDDSWLSHPSRILIVHQQREVSIMAQMYGAELREAEEVH